MSIFREGAGDAAEFVAFEGDAERGEHLGEMSFDSS
jgi:hypothetical protein